MLRVTPNALLLCCAPLVACAHLVAPERGGPQWIQVTTENFVVRTELGEDAARQFVSQLQSIQAAFALAGFGVAVPASARTHLVVFLNAGELKELTGRPRSEQIEFRDPDGVIQQTTSMEVSPGDNASLLAALAYGMPEPFEKPLPAWVRVGTAEFVSSAEVSSESLRIDGHSALGELDTKYFPQHTDLVRNHSPQLRSWDSGAWLLVHYLRHTYPEGFTRFLRDLALGTSEQAAFAAAFDWVSNEDLDARLDQYAKDLPSANQSVQLQPYKGMTRVEPLSAAEVHALWAELFLYSQAFNVGKTEAARLRQREDDELAVARSLDPDAVGLRVVEAAPARLSATARLAPRSSPRRAPVAALA